MIWRGDDPPFNIGTPRLSVLRRRVHRLRYLCDRDRERFKKALSEAIEEMSKEEDFVFRTETI